METWETWRARLTALRHEVDKHLKSAEALAGGPTSIEREAVPSERASALPCTLDTASREPASATRDSRRNDSTREVRFERSHAIQSAQLRRALDHVAAHYDQPLSLAQLARIAGCSREHLARACRRETGSTVHGHVVALRLARAASEVGAGDKIEAVMLGVGYRGKRNFYRQFKARFGMTPGRYRTAAMRVASTVHDGNSAASTQNSPHGSE
jgi:AraC-like DNA-binding protein